MATDLSDRVREIAREQEVPESEVFEQALERGIDAIYREVVLKRYVEGSLDRAEAVELVGWEAVREAERQVQAVEEDVQWGTEA